MRLSVFNGVSEEHIFELDALPHPLVSRMADGNWLLAEARSRAGARNGHIYDSDGTLIASIVLGDGIAHLQCSPDNTIWVGYFDEGVYGNQLPDGSWPVSSGGIVNFSADGAVLSSYNKDEMTAGGIDDCYALTLDNHIAWTCYYSDFPIVAISGDGINVWENAIAGAAAIAVDGRHVLLAGGYRENARRLALVELHEKQSRRVRSLEIPTPQSDGASMMQGVGQTLHIVADGCWTRVTVSSIRDLVAKRR